MYNNDVPPYIQYTFEARQNDIGHLEIATTGLNNNDYFTQQSHCRVD